MFFKCPILRGQAHLQVTPANATTKNLQTILSPQTHRRQKRCSKNERKNNERQERPAFNTVY